MNQTESKQINDGGPAFSSPAHGNTSPEPGMSLRAYIATKVMAATVSNQSALKSIEDASVLLNRSVPYCLSQLSISYADALIAELEKKQ